MPKQPGGISKTIRVQTILDVLKKWGVLDKNEIDEKVSILLYLDKKNIERALYRDLEELVVNNKIKVINKDRLGKVVEFENCDDTGYKNFWCLEEYEPNSIIGLQRLVGLGANLIVFDTQMKNSIVVDEFNKNDLGKLKNCIAFNINNINLVLKIDEGNYPYDLIICRGTKESIATINLNKEKYSRRSIFLFLPMPFLSSIKKDCLFGSIVLKRESLDQFKITFNKNDSFHFCQDANTDSIYSDYFSNDSTRQFSAKKSKDLISILIGNSSGRYCLLTGFSISFYIL